MRKIGIIVGCLILCLGLALPSVAQAVTPRWIGLSSVECDISFYGTTGTVSASLVGNANVTALRGTLKLYRGIFKIDEWEIDVQDNYWAVLEEFTGVSGKSYTLKLDAEAYVNGTWESVETDDSADCP